MDLDVCITGNGPTARLAQAALDGLGLAVGRVGPADPRDDDPRTTALLPGAVDDLAALGIDVAPLATPIEALLIQATGPFGLSEEAFEAAEAGTPWLALNVAVGDLVGLLPSAGRIDGTVAGLEVIAGGVRLRLGDGGAVTARLVVAADGAGSPTRAAAGIPFRRLPIGRDALALPVAHDCAHDGLCIERYDDAGSLTLIPAAGPRSALITIGDPARIAAMAAADDATLGRVLGMRQPAFGRLRPAGRRAVFRLCFGWSPGPVAGRVVAIGEAAHVLPPIGAQGWNLSVADVAALRRLLEEGAHLGLDPGATEVIGRYPRDRVGGQLARLGPVALLTALATRPAGPVTLARQLGLSLLGRARPLKSGLMRHGLR